MSAIAANINNLIMNTRDSRWYSLLKSNLKSGTISKIETPAILQLPASITANNDSDRFDILITLLEQTLSTGKNLEIQVNEGIINGERLGFRKPIIGVLVRKLVLDLKKGKSRESLKSECGDFLWF